MKGKRKPNLLCLDTGAANNSIRTASLASPGIPTMLQRRGLERSASTPRMIATPMYGPAGGMTLWPQLGASRLEIKKSNQDNMSNYNPAAEEYSEIPTGVQMATRLPGVTVGGDAFDRAHSSEDTGLSGYPDGPILMHEPNIFLYSEPRVDEIMNFDVVINVAREVKCPSEIAETISQAPQRQRAFPTIRLDRAKSDSGLENSTIKSIISIPSNSSKQCHILEYIHAPWDHNTDVKDELWDLCQFMESRSKMGKKILVHCQQGASRSATLIIAYGMYINQDIGLNESYQIVQSKSPWVNPNMSLLFSLNDFKKVINEKKFEMRECSSSILSSDLNLTEPIIEALTSNASENLNISHKSPIDPLKSRSETSVERTVNKGTRSMLGPENEIDSTISRLGAFDFGYSTLSPKRDDSKWKNLGSCLEKLSSLERLPRAFGSEQEANHNASYLSSRVADFSQPFEESFLGGVY